MNTSPRNNVEARENKFRNLIMEAPAIFCILKGDQHVFELANLRYKELVGNREIIGKPIREALPELEGQGFYELLDNVYSTGETFIGKEVPANLIKSDGSVELGYFNFTYQAYTGANNETEGILVFANEITEQVESRRKIEASEKRFSNILSQSVMAIAIFKSPEMIVSFANQPMLNALGKGDTILNKPLLEGVPELKEQAFSQMLTELYTSGLAYEEFETKIILIRNGIPEDTYFNFVYQPYRDVDQAITGITVLATEITEQVLAKKQIAISEAKFKMLSETIPHMVWTATPDGKKNFFNKYFLDYTGLSFEDVKGEGWHNIIFPDDLKLELALWQENIKTGNDFKIEKRVRHHSGTYKWHLSHSIPQKNEEGEITGWIGTNTEIEDQKKITETLVKGEEQFRTFANNIRDLAWIADGSGWIYWYNQRWYDYTGTTIEEMEGWGWGKVHHPDHINQVMEFVKEAW
ncbi:MAG: PAS domain S-box protein, partial [Ferruginibacter sp.]